MEKNSIGGTFPLVFLVFNRPETTTRVFGAIRNSRPERLYVVADGPRRGKPGETALCDEVRMITEKVDWPCQVFRNYAEENMGCGRRVSSGIDWVFEREESAIFLEDDCLPHPDFFSFCGELLERYRNDDRVMMVSGDNFVPKADLGDTSYVFSRYFAIWGWATWRRAWRMYDRSLSGWTELKRQRQLDTLCPYSQGRRFLTALFNGVASGRVDTWDVQWVFTCLFNNGLSVVPRVNLVSNIGLEGAHVSRKSRRHLLPVGPLDWPLRHPEKVFADRRYDHAFYSDIHDPWWTRLAGKIKGGG